MRSFTKHCIVGAGVGALIGVFLFHPFSMVLERMIHPVLELEFYELKKAFSPHHLPMAVFFGILGTLIGIMNAYYLSSISREKERVRLLEELIPICSYCKNIRDDGEAEHGSGTWMKMEQYFAREADASFTHGICPECYERVMKEIDETWVSKSQEQGTSALRA
jgi:hypothetical protein